MDNLSLIGYDKIKLNINDFEISGVNPALHRQAVYTIDPQTGRQSRDCIYREPPPITMFGVNYRLHNNLLVIEYNPANGIKPARSQSLLNSAGIVQQGLNEIGVKCDLDNAKLGRVDITRNCCIDYNYRLYENVFNRITGKRHLKRDKEYNAIGSSKTFYYQNRLKKAKKNGSVSHNMFNECICVYDKSAERKLDFNLLRAEYRLMDQRKTESRFKGAVFSDLWRDDYMEYAEQIYKSNIEKNLFYLPEISDYEIDNGIEMFKSYYQAYSNREKSVSRALIKTVASMNEYTGSLLKCGVVNLFDMAGVEFNNRMAKNRAVREIEQILENAGRIQSIKNGKKKVGFNDFYNELKYKLCG